MGVDLSRLGLWFTRRAFFGAGFVSALVACSGGGGGGPYGPPGGSSQTPTPTPSPTATPLPCATVTPAPASGNAVFYLAPSCSTANTAAGFTIAGDARGLLVAASTVDESVPFATVSQPPQALQSPPGSDSVEVSIAAGESATALRRKAHSERAIDLRFLHPTQTLSARRFKHARVIPRRKLAALLGASSRGGAGIVARKRSILPTTLGSTAGIWTVNSSGNYVQVSSTLEYASTYGDVWVDNTLLSTGGGPLTTAAIQTLGADYDNAWLAVTPVLGTPDYSPSSIGSQETTTNCSTGQTEPIFIPDPDNRQAVFVISSASNGGFGSYFDPANLVYDDVATSCLSAESNERSGVYLQYNVGSSADTLTQQLEEDDVVLGANDLAHLVDFVGHTITNPGNDDETFLQTGYIDSPFITEGLGSLAEDFAVHRMYPQLSIDVDDNAQSAQTYLATPASYSLTAFYGTDPGASPATDCIGCFGQAYLFTRYAYDRFGESYPSALVNSGLTGFQNLANAFGAATTPQNVIADFAVATAVSGEGLTTDSRFNVAGFTTFGSYTDQFGNVLALNGPTAAATQNVASDTTYEATLGSFLYLQIGGLPASATVQVTDGNGSFGLEAALSQH